MLKTIERTQSGVDGLIDSTRDAVLSGADGAEERIERAADTLVRNSHSAADQVRQGADSAAKSAHKNVQGAAKALDRGFARTQRDLARFGNNAAEYVSENPGKAVAAAVAVGFLVGLFVQRRRLSA